MDSADPRRALDALVVDRGESYAALSRMLRRNAAYLQQYVKRGTPRVLAERDRRMLAGYFGVDEAVLGAPISRQASGVAVRRLDIAASAGPGRLVDREAVSGETLFDPALLRRLGIDPAAAAMLRADGDSMAPTICTGDLMLVDERDRRVAATAAIFVLRLHGTLLVKRVARDGAVLHVTSDNPATPPIDPQPPEAVTIMGRVVWLSRALR